MDKCGFCSRRMCGAVSGSTVCEPDLYRSSFSADEAVALFEDWGEASALKPGQVEICVIPCGCKAQGYVARMAATREAAMEAAKSAACPTCGRAAADIREGFSLSTAWDVQSETFLRLMANGR